MNKKNLFPFLLTLILLFFLSSLLFWKWKNNQLENGNGKEKISEETEIKYIEYFQIEKIISQNEYRIVDIRPKELFELSHLESSVNYPIANQALAEDIPSNIFPKDKKIIIIDETESELGKKITQKLIAEKFEAFLLKGGLEEYQYVETKGLVSSGNINNLRDRVKVNSISIEELIQRDSQKEIFKFLDVRRKNDFEKKYLENSVNIPLEELEGRKDEVPIGKTIVVDEDPLRSFQAAVRLYDMNILGVYCLAEKLSELEKKVSERKN